MFIPILILKYTLSRFQCFNTFSLVVVTAPSLCILVVTQAEAVDMAANYPDTAKGWLCTLLNNLDILIMKRSVI